VIYPPRVALVGFGRLVERPWTAADGTVAARPIITASLSADHRASGGRFLAAIEQLLRKPGTL